MSETSVFNAEIRERAGKGAARAVRRAGRVPAVIYGEKKDPIIISLDPKELKKEIMAGNFFARIAEVKIGKDVEKFCRVTFNCTRSPTVPSTSTFYASAKAPRSPSVLQSTSSTKKTARASKKAA